MKIPIPWQRFRGLAIASVLAVACAAGARAAESPDEAVDEWLQSVGNADVSSVAEKLLGQLEEEGFPLTGRRRDAVKGLIKKRLVETLKQDVRSEGMDAITRKIADALTQYGPPKRRAALKIAYTLPSDLSSSRVVTGMFNTWTDVFVDTLTGGAGTAAKLVALPGRTLALEWVEALLAKLQELEGALDESGGGLEVYRSRRTVEGCESSMVVLWNKVAGTHRFAIFGDCKCRAVGKVNLGRWTVSGSGLARWSNGRHSGVTVRTSKSLARGVVVDAYCCGRTGESVRYPESVDPWFKATTVAPGGGIRPRRESVPRAAPTPNPPTPPTPRAKPTPGVPPPSTPSPVRGGGGPMTPADVPDLPRGPVGEEEKDALIDQAGAAYAGALDTYQTREAMLNSLVDSRAAEAKLAEARAELARAKELLERAQRTLDEAYQLETTPADDEQSLYEGEEDESFNVGLFDPCFEGVTLSEPYETYEERFFAQTWPCSSCPSFGVAEAAEVLEHYWNAVLAAERSARAALSQHPLASIYDFVLESDGFYDHHKQMMCRSLEALATRCAVSGEEGHELRAGILQMLAAHRDLMRVLAASRRLRAGQVQYALDQGALRSVVTRVDKRYFQPLASCDTC